MYVNKIEKRITFEIKTGYYLELLRLETMKLLGSTGNKITIDKNGENVPDLEITEWCRFIVILLTMIISKIQESYVHLFQISHLVVY